MGGEFGLDGGVIVEHLDGWRAVVRLISYFTSIYLDSLEHTSLCLTPLGINTVPVL